MKKTLSPVFVILFGFIAVHLSSQTLAKEKWDTPAELEMINTHFGNNFSSPYISSDGKQLYLASSGKIYYMERSDSGWTAPEPVSDLLNGKYVDNPRISHDRLQLYFTQSLNDGNQIFYLERSDTFQIWQNVKSLEPHINTNSIKIEDIYLPNDSTLYASNNYQMFVSSFNKDLNQWDSLKHDTRFDVSFFSGYFGGFFINQNLSKVYHTMLYRIWWEDETGFHEQEWEVLAVSYRNAADHFEYPLELNISRELDTLYNSLPPDYYMSDPSLTDSGDDIYFVVNKLNYTDSLEILKTVYHSKLLIKDSNAVNISSKNKYKYPEEVGLFQNYPNPFNTTTKIRYRIPAITHASLKIYSLTGQEIVTVVDRMHNPGQYEIEWDASRYASGIYLYILHTVNFTDSKKLVLIK